MSPCLSTGVGLLTMLIIALLPASAQQRKRDTVSVPQIKEKAVHSLGLTPSALAVTSEDPYVVGADMKHALAFFHLDTGRHKFSLEGHGNVPTHLALTPDGRKLLSLSTERSGRERMHNLLVWDARSGKALNQGWYLASGTPCHLSAEHWLLATTQGYPSVLDLKTGKELELQSRGEYIQLVRISPDGKRVLTCGTVDGERPVLCCWEYPTGKLLWSRHFDFFRSRQSPLDTWYEKRGSPPTHLIVSPDNRTVLLASLRDSVFYDMEDGYPMYSAPRGCKDVHFSPDGRWLAYNVLEHINVYSTYKQTLVAQLKPSAAPNEGIPLGQLTAFSPDGRAFVATSTDGRVRVWDWPKLDP